MNYKIKILHIIFLSLFIPIFLFLFYLQIIKGEYYYKRSIGNIIRIIPEDGIRGEIFDTNGKKLVENYPSFNVIAVPQEIKNLDNALDILSDYFSISKEILIQRYQNRYRVPFVPVNLIEDLPKSLALRFKSEKNIPGILVNVQVKRRYNYSNAASHILGYIGRIEDSQFKILKQYGYSSSDYIGKMGIEAYYDSYLKGESGGELVEVDSLGRQIQVIGKRVPEKGKDLRLTLDIDLQEYIQELAKEIKGAIVVMEPKTGNIKALVSKPDFDPNIFLNPRENHSYINRILHSPDSPLLNRVTLGTYPPGSIFKIVLAAAGLETGKIKSNDKKICTGSTFVGPQEFRCWYRQGHRNINLNEALRYSCNVFFYELGLKIGVDSIYEFSKKFGLGERTYIDLLEESSGIVPNRDYKREKFNSTWYAGDTANLSIGQGYIQLTPIQVLKMVSLVANRGFIVRPKIVEYIEDVYISSPQKKRIDISPVFLKEIHNGLVSVVEHPDGTGRLAKVEGLTIAGKTGTAQVANRPSHGWFIGYAPAEDPEICLVVMIEHGGRGGLKPAKISRDIFEYYVRHKENM